MQQLASWQNKYDPLARKVILPVLTLHLQPPESQAWRFDSPGRLQIQTKPLPSGSRSLKVSLKTVVPSRGLDFQNLLWVNADLKPQL